MDYLLDAITGAFRLIFSLDPEVVTITLLSLRVALSATVVAAVLGIPLAYFVATREFRGKGALLTLFNTLMALPTVVVGLFCYSFLSRRGPLGFLEREPLSSARPTALVGLVCRSKGNRNRLVVQRTLGGDTEASFPPLEFEPGGDRCIQYRDMVPPDMMTEGEFRFQVTVVEKGEILATTERSFAVLDGREATAENLSDER